MKYVAKQIALKSSLSFFWIISQLVEGYSRKTTLDYVRMLYKSYGSVCELETQILLAGDLDLIEKDELKPLSLHPQSGWAQEVPPRGGTMTLGKPRWGYLFVIKI